MDLLDFRVLPERLPDNWTAQRSFNDGRVALLRNLPSVACFYCDDKDARQTVCKGGSVREVVFREIR